MGRVLTSDALIQEVRHARAAGRSIALASGCFDPLHVGHVRYLDGAGCEADVLVVAVFDDASVRALKGAGRPVLVAAHRTELVAALRCVDFVVVPTEPTVESLLDVLRPEVLCVGPDSGMGIAVEDGAHAGVGGVADRARVHARGGRIAIVGGPKDHSSRQVLARMSASGSSSGGGQ